MLDNPSKQLQRCLLQFMRKTTERKDYHVPVAQIPKDDQVRTNPCTYRMLVCRGHHVSQGSSTTKLNF